MLLSWLNCIYLYVFKKSLLLFLPVSFWLNILSANFICLYKCVYVCTHTYIHTHINKQKSSLNISYANVLSHTECSMASFIKFHSYWCCVDLLYYFWKAQPSERRKRLLEGLLVTDLSLRPEKASRETGSVIFPGLLGAPAPRSLVIPLGLFPGVIWSGWEGVLVVHESELLSSRKLK